MPTFELPHNFKPHLIELSGGAKPPVIFRKSGITVEIPLFGNTCFLTATANYLFLHEASYGNVTGMKIAFVNNRGYTPQWCRAVYCPLYKNPDITAHDGTMIREMSCCTTG